MKKAVNVGGLHRVIDEETGQYLRDFFGDVWTGSKAQAEDAALRINVVDKNFDILGELGIRIDK